MHEKQLLETFLCLKPCLRSFVCERLGNRSPDVEDILQEAWLKAWLHRNCLRSEANISSWLYAIVRNECCTYFRKQYIKYEVLLSDISSIPEQESMEALVVSRIDFFAALSCLNANLQEVMHMHYGQGMEIREIAALMKCPDGTVKRMLFQARSQIRAAS